MKLRPTAAIAIAILTVGGAWAASDDDKIPLPPIRPTTAAPKHDKAATTPAAAAPAIAAPATAAAPAPNHDKAATAPVGATTPTPAPSHDKPATAPTTTASTPPPGHDKPAPAPLNQFKTAAGFWQEVDDDGFVGGWFYFTEHDGLFDGRLVKAFKKPGAPEYSDKCDKCEGDQKDAAMLGLTIVKGMKRDHRNYDGGSILDPRDGTVYHAQMDLSADGKELHVRGYLGIPMFGKTVTWRRLPDDAMKPEEIPPESVGPAAAASK